MEPIPPLRCTGISPGVTVGHQRSGYGCLGSATLQIWPDWFYLSTHHNRLHHSILLLPNHSYSAFPKICPQTHDKCTDSTGQIKWTLPLVRSEESHGGAISRDQAIPSLSSRSLHTISTNSSSLVLPSPPGGHTNLSLTGTALTAFPLHKSDC